MTEKERMLAGQLYLASDPQLQRDAQRARSLLRAIRETTEEEGEQRLSLFKQLFAKTGDSLFIEPPFYCDYGQNITIGEDFYANFDCVILDVCPVEIGDHVLFGPRVCIYTAAHPLDTDLRRRQLEYGRPVRIGSDVWVGGNSIINPGVSIGHDVVIGSGSVVTRDIPSHVIAAGNPCRVLRPITQEDRVFWTMRETQER